jgi:acetyl-CoA/propionyl-CoA carboxylase biotin carboxyl carrier protein
VLKKILVANRGEIAVRVIAACRALGVTSVAVHSRRDAGALHVEAADESVALAEDGATTPYLDVEAIVDAARTSGADAVHPGYGFLAESAALAQAVLDAGLVWIGPRPRTIADLGDKREARLLAVAAGLPVVPGSDGVIGSHQDVVDLGEAGGWPVVVKAAFGGGGRGMRVVHSPDDAEAMVAAAQRESQKAFGDDALLAERFVVDARHVEVQVVADTHGTVVAIGDRECSVQRRHQKLVEEAPASNVPDAVRAALADESVLLFRHVGYEGAGTVEFLVVGDEHFFLEVNTRIQVEHPVTEAVTGVDLVAEQIRVAAGERLSVDQTPVPRGHAVEVRLNAEDPFRGFVPASGRLETLQVPAQVGLRVDSGYRSGDVVPPDFDSLVAKVIVHAADRDQALRRLAAVLRTVDVRGLPTTLPALADVVGHPDFVAGDVHTAWFEEVVEPELDLDDPRAHARADDLVDVAGAVVRLVALPLPDGTARALRPRRSDTGAGDRGRADGVVRSPMIGVVLAVHAEPGTVVTRGDALLTVEAMKMENLVRSDVDGTVETVEVAVTDSVAAGQVLVRVTPAG